MKVEAETTLLAAISDLLDVSRAVSGTLTLDLLPLDVSWPLRGAVATCAGEAAKKALSVTCDMDAPTAVALHGGAVSASSDGPDQGTSVRVGFPILQDVRPEGGPSHPALARLSLHSRRSEAEAR